MKQNSKATPKPNTTAPRKLEPAELTQLQDVMLDSLADLFHNGGNPEDVDSLVDIALVHRERLTHGSFRDEKDVQEVIKTAQQRNFDRWKAEIRKLHKANNFAKNAKPVPKNASERFRENIRWHLRTDFANFLEFGAAEELHLMGEVLAGWASINVGPVAPVAGVPLADAFASEIDNGNGYLKVPDKYVSLIEDFVQLLHTSEEAEKKVTY